jgi:glucose-6-phosphate isomerase
MTTLSLRQRPATQDLEVYFADVEGPYLDYPKNQITVETVRLLINLANESGLGERRERIFRGKCMNVFEDRAVRHSNSKPGPNPNSPTTRQPTHS